LKILDRYILTTFLKTFFSVFTILIFIFILQSVWLFVKELAGKDLDLIIVIKFLVYLLPTLVPLILPLTILLTAIMIFGNFAENYEFAAMKSAGISLQRAMRGVSVFILLLSITTFFFANNVVPWGEYKSRNLRRNIAMQSPAMAIVAGQFNPIGDKITIKVDKKFGENGNQLENVTVFLKENNKNTTVIKAKTGELISSKKSNILQLVLYNGNYYNDVHTRAPKKRKKSPHVKSYFKKYTKNFDLSKLVNPGPEPDAVVTHRMLKMNELIPTIDSLEQRITTSNNKDIENYYNGLGLHITKKKKPEKYFTKDTLAKKTLLAVKNDLKKISVAKKATKDSIPVFNGDLIDLFNDEEKKAIYKLAASNSSNSYTQIENREKLLQFSTSNLNQHKISLHKKLALAISCFLLFFVGAPLGAIIRKGGMGLPMVIAILLFLSYYFIGIFAENSAEKGAMPTFLGAWLSTIIILPLGIVLTRNATSDKDVFNTDGITTFFMSIYDRFSIEGKIVETEEKIKEIKRLEDNYDHRGGSYNHIFKQYIIIDNIQYKDIEYPIIDLINKYSIKTCGVFKQPTIESSFLIGFYEDVPLLSLGGFKLELKNKLEKVVDLKYTTNSDKNDEIISSINYQHITDVISNEELENREL